MFARSNVTEKFKVISVSTNTNSFGLHGVIIVSPLGKAFEVGITSQFAPKKDEMVNIDFPVTIVNDMPKVGELPISCNNATIEIPRKLPDCPQKILTEIFK